MRVLAVMLLCVSVVGCAVMRTGGPGEDAVEQFAFEARPGSGTGPEADALVGGFGENPENADHIATIPTPLGDLTIVEFTDQGGPCRGLLIGDAFGSVGCAAPGGDLGSGAAPDELRVTGVGQIQDWAMVELEAGENVASVAATAADGRVYRAELVDGIGVILYPLERGELSIQALDTESAPVGPPVISDSMGGPESPPEPGS
jgi:hypothetical protein